MIKTIAFFAASSLALLLSAACGGETTPPPDCSIDAPGKNFTFTINNTGTRNLRLAYGCGTNYPITLTTTHGTLGIGAETAEFCGTSCDAVYKGYINFGCSDCGPGYGADLGPGASATIQWDRRVYQHHTAPMACSGNESGNDCALGMLVTETTVSGTLSVCNDGSMTTPGDGYCSTDNLEPFPFTLDLSKDSISVDVQ